MWLELDLTNYDVTVPLCHVNDFFTDVYTVRIQLRHENFEKVLRGTNSKVITLRGIFKGEWKSPCGVVANVLDYNILATVLDL